MKALCACLFFGLLLAQLTSCASDAQALAAEYYNLGNDYVKLGNWTEAGRVYAKALRYNPKLRAASFELAHALIESGDAKQALAIVEELGRKKEADNLQLLTLKAYAYFKAGRYEEATTTYLKVLEHNNDNYDANYNLALLELASDKAPIAIARLEALIGRKQGDSRVNLLLARAYEGLKTKDLSDEEKAANLDKALSFYEQAAKIGKLSAEDQLHLASLYEGKKRFANAVVAYVEATKVDDKNSKAWFNLARLRLTVVGEAKQGLEDLKTALASGFSDKEMAKKLLDEPTLSFRTEIVKLFADKGLNN